MTGETEREKIKSFLAGHECTMEAASFDDCNQVHLCASKLLVLRYDDMPEIYQRQTGCPMRPSSNDALYISKDGKWYFIEFKNGKPKKAEIHDKIYDSVIMMIELGLIPGFDFSRQHIHYILVFDEVKNKNLQSSPSLDEMNQYFGCLAKDKLLIMGVGRFENYLLKDVQTYSRQQFQEYFLDPMERMEGILSAV